MITKSFKELIKEASKSEESTLELRLYSDNKYVHKLHNDSVMNILSLLDDDNINFEIKVIKQNNNYTTLQLNNFSIKHINNIINK